jgi:hypothetical protein
MFKQLTLAATLAATATFAAPGAQAFSLGDALGIANTVINTVQTIENGVNGNQPAPQVQQPQQQAAPTASEQQQIDESMAILCDSNSGGTSVAAIQMLGMSNVQCSDEQNASHDQYQSEVRQLTVQCQAALGPAAYWSESNGACRDGRPSVGSDLRGPGTVSYGAQMR